jgi:predicted DsbA family dithiol-disulfide isomerase
MGSSMSEVRITEFTDPGCPWAYSAEPARRRLDWLYGEGLEWRVNVVGLAETREEQEEKGFTPEDMAENLKKISADHGMPIDTRVREAVSATVDACRAIVAARGHDPDREWQLLRCLRVDYFAGGLLDDPELIRDAARTAGIDPDELESWMAEDETEEALREDLARAREPMPAARALDYKLANWSGGRRYTCPSYEIERLEDGVKVSVPGFQPFASYDVILANLLPDLERRDPPDDAAEVLRWAGTPLASQEVATVMDISRPEAREALGRVAEERHVGADGFWTLV